MCTERECHVRIFVPGRSFYARSSQGLRQVTGECLSFTQMHQGAFAAQELRPSMGWWGL